MEPTVLEAHSRILSYIPRWGIIRTLRQQSVAEHSYYVTLYSMHIAERLSLNPIAKQRLVEMAITHDFDEMVSGDIPTPYKLSIKSVQKSTTAMMSVPMKMKSSVCSSHYDHSILEDILKLADVFEAAMFISDEEQMGNRTVSNLLDNLSFQVRARACNLIDKDFADELQVHIDHCERTRLCTEDGL